MRPSTLGNALLIAGAADGAVAIGAVVTGYSPDLTPEMIKLLFYKGFGAAAVGLMVVGTFIGKIGREREKKTEFTDGDRTALPAVQSSEGMRLDSTRCGSGQSSQRDGPDFPHLPDF